MKKKRRGAVDIQKISEMRGSVHDYERFVSSHGDEESTLSNPDLLPEQKHTPSTPQLIMGEAIAHLQGRQKEVYLSIMRDDKSMSETGEVLGISKSSVQVYLDRAIAFITGYCEQAMKKGRI